jgi:hypothetical protein
MQKLNKYYFYFYKKITNIINRELSELLQIQYACPSCFNRVAILLFLSGNINCFAISSF